MFFFIAGSTTKLAGQETVKVNKNGFLVNAEVKVFKQYITVFFIPLIPIGKKFSIYIPHTDEYYENNYFSKIPSEYLEICKRISAKY